MRSSILMDDLQFQKLLDLLGLSWRGYRKVRKGVKKRIARYMQEREFPSMEVLLSSLKASQEVRNQVEKLTTVSISRFFRDRNLWQSLEKHILPAVVAQAGAKVTVWSAGCASGEEIYSFKILWEEWAGERNQVPELEPWGTDRNEELLERARAGVYSSSSLKEVPEAWRTTRYFRPVQGNRWAISDSLKEGIRWKVHNLLIDEPPANEFQIVFLRNNLLTYYKEEILRPRLSRVGESLSPGGFLIIGAHEKLPAESGRLALSPHLPFIFREQI